MTLHAFCKLTNKSLKCADLPLQFVDWTVQNFSGKFISFLASVDPYGDILIPDNIAVFAATDFKVVRTHLRETKKCDVPQIVELYGKYGRSGALKTIDQVLNLIDFAKENNYKIVSIGD